ncbi:MAG TPA: histidine phosphatase family protein [Blastocatellia bacterium]|nr:histidine phosphatase family protein [Blastocatellia bacterium]
MSLIYLVRHAQAGTRDNYDVLSDLGREQARLLGDNLVSQGISLGAVYSGSLQRQRLTAEIACSAFSRAGLSHPDVVTDHRWDEFNLRSIYVAISKRLCEESSEFARDFEEMDEALRKDPHTTRGATGRCDAAVIRAWMDNRYPDYQGESWAGFRDRIKSCLADFESGAESAVAVFTSATPIAILAAASLELTDEKFLSILGVIYNSSVTVIGSREGEMRLFSFNSTSHLPHSIRTLR